MLLERKSFFVSTYWRNLLNHFESRCACSLFLRVYPAGRTNTDRILRHNAMLQLHAWKVSGRQTHFDSNVRKKEREIVRERKNERQATPLAASTFLQRRRKKNSSIIWFDELNECTLLHRKNGRECYLVRKPIFSVLLLFILIFARNESCKKNFQTSVIRFKYVHMQRYIIKRYMERER